MRPSSRRASSGPFCNFSFDTPRRLPLLIVLENLHWTDPSSLELLHFIARQLSGARVAILCTYSSSERESSQVLRTTEHSLVGVGLATSQQLAGLPPSATTELLRRVFGAAEDTVREFAGMLYGSTRGNPLFLEQTIKSLVGSGRLRQRDGSWHGWELEDLQLPAYIRDLFLARIQRLSPEALHSWRSWRRWSGFASPTTCFVPSATSPPHSC